MQINDPLVSEFDSPQAATEYDAWLRAKVAKSLQDEQPTHSHASVMAEMARTAADIEMRSRLRELGVRLITDAVLREYGLRDDEIGALVPGRKADVVLHDTDRPEWRPLLNVMNQLVWSADGRGVHTVLVDGKVVVEDGHCTTIDEEKLWADAQRMGEAITARSGLPDKAKYPIW